VIYFYLSYIISLSV